MPAEFSVFIDGKYRKMSLAQIKELAPGRIDGQGAFETLQSDKGRIFAFDEHMARLRRSLHLLRMEPQYSSRKIQGVFKSLCKKNCLKHARLRIVVWRGNGKRHISLVAIPTTRPSESKYKRGYRAITSSLRRNPSRLSHVKTIDYEIFHAAHQEAKDKGFDEATLLNDKGFLVEASYANLFFVRKGVLCTPAVECGCLNGIIRQKVLQLARRNNIPCRIGRFRLNDLLKSDEAFLTNSIIEIMPLVKAGRNRIGSGLPGAVTQRLSCLLQEIKARA